MEPVARRSEQPAPTEDDGTCPHPKRPKQPKTTTVLGLWVRPVLSCLWPSDVLSASLVSKEFARIGQEHPVWSRYAEFVARPKPDPGVRAQLKMWRPWWRPVEHFQLTTKMCELNWDPSCVSHFCPSCQHYSADSYCDEGWQCAVCIGKEEFNKNEALRRFRLRYSDVAEFENGRHNAYKVLDALSAKRWGSLDAAMAAKRREQHRDIAQRDVEQQRERVLDSVWPARWLAPALYSSYEKKARTTGKLGRLRAVCKHGAFLAQFTQATGTLEDVLAAYAEPHAAKTEKQFQAQLRRDGFPAKLRLKALKAGRPARLLHRLAAAGAEVVPEVLNEPGMRNYVRARRGAGTAEAVVADVLRKHHEGMPRRRDALLAELRRRNVPEDAVEWAKPWVTLGKSVERAATELAARYRRERAAATDELILFNLELKAWLDGEGTEAADDVLPAARQRAAESRVRLGLPPSTD